MKGRMLWLVLTIMALTAAGCMYVPATTAPAAPAGRVPGYVAPLPPY